MRAAQIPRFPLLVAMLIFSLSAHSIELHETFDSSQELDAWATDFYFGGHRIVEFERNGKCFVVVIGGFTSGLPTSQLLVYQKISELHKLALFRNTTGDHLDVNENEEGLVFTIENDVVLQVSWRGLTVFQAGPGDY